MRKLEIASIATIWFGILSISMIQFFESSTTIWIGSILIITGCILFVLARPLNNKDSDYRNIKYQSYAKFAKYQRRGLRKL